MVYKTDALYVARAGAYQSCGNNHAFAEFLASIELNPQIEASALKLQHNCCLPICLELVELKADVVSLTTVIDGMRAVGLREPAPLAETLAVLCAEPLLAQRSSPILALGTVQRQHGKIIVPWIEFEDDHCSVDVLEHDDGLWGHYFAFAIH